MTESYEPCHKKQKLINDFFPYTRINHFDNMIDPFLIKEHLDIPDQLLVDLKAEFAKQKINNIDRLQLNCIKKCLRKLGYQKYYEYAPYIKSKLTGKEPVFLTLKDAEKLKIMFQQIQEPFEQTIRLLNNGRANFLNYTYVLYKLAELCGLDNMLQQFALLKSREKLLGNDKIWKNICEINGWTFIPTIKN